MKENTNKHTVRNDLFLIVVFLVIAGIGALYLFVLRGTGDTVRVTVNGAEYATYSLSENIVKDIITGENGEYCNTLVIRDGIAYMEKATCPDGICVDHSPIYRDGESIVCLPQRVVITVVTHNDDNSPDIIV